jgi:hypothetical protein
VTAWLDSKQVAKLHADLTQIPTLYADLPNVLTGIKGIGGGGRKPPGSKPPLSVQVVSLLDGSLKDAHEWRTTDPRDRDVLDRYGVTPRVGLWVRLVADEMADAGERPVDVADEQWTDLAALCAALWQANAWIITQQWAGDLAHDMHTLRGELEQALGVHPEYKPKCRNVWCGGKLEPMDGGSWYRCPDCEREYVVAADLKALGEAQYLRGEDVAQLLDIAWSTLRRFKAEGWVRPIAYTASGVALFDLDAVRLVRDTPVEERVKVS